MLQARVTLGIVVLALVVLGGGLVVRSPAVAQPFNAEGDIEASNPVLGFGATEIEFIDTCPEMPDSQGVDGYVFELPRSLDGQTALARGESAGPYDLDFSFYGADCAGTGTSASGDAKESARVPAKTKFVVVNAALGAQIHVCLTVGGGACGASSSPPASSSSGPPSSSTSPSTSPTGSSSSSPSPSGSSPTASSSPSPPSGTVNTSIKSNHRVVKRRAAFVLSGEVSASATCQRPYYVELSRSVGRSSERVSVDDRIPVSNRNGWTYEYSSRVSARYFARAVASNCQSESAASTVVGVRVAITAKADAPCRAPHRIKGKVRPRHPGTNVILKRAKGKKSKAVDRDQLDKRSRYVLVAPRCAGKFRIVWPAQSPRNAKGTRRFHF